MTGVTTDDWCLELVSGENWGPPLRVSRRGWGERPVRTSNYGGVADTKMCHISKMCHILIAKMCHISKMCKDVSPKTRRACGPNSLASLIITVRRRGEPPLEAKLRQRLLPLAQGGPVATFSMATGSPCTLWRHALVRCRFKRYPFGCHHRRLCDRIAGGARSAAMVS